MNTEEIEFFKAQGIEIESNIAKGGFGQLFLVYSHKYDAKFAMKRVPLKCFNRNEIECLKRVDHVGIIDLYQYYIFGENVYLLMDYCPTDLFHLFKNEDEISDDLLAKYIRDILIAIKACHDINIAHNDIKPSNFLIDRYGRIKVCDFGLSRCYEENQLSSTFKGTLLFMAPELLKKIEFNAIKADIWALGVTFFYMATRTYPFLGSCGDMCLKLIKEGNYPLFAVRNPLLRQLIGKCLAVNPEERPSIDELLKLPYFKGYETHCSYKLLPNAVRATKPIIKPKCNSVKPIISRLSVIPCKRCILVSPRE